MVDINKTYYNPDFTIKAIMNNDIDFNVDYLIGLGYTKDKIKKIIIAYLALSGLSSFTINNLVNHYLENIWQKEKKQS